MFEKINKSKLSRTILWKYFFQIFLTPLFWAAVMLSALLVVTVFSGVKNASTGELILGSLFMGAFIGTPNLLSLLPFFRLLADNLTGNKTESGEFKVIDINDQWELSPLRVKKRFIIDTFSKKKNDEIRLTTETKRAKRMIFRFYWNESYGEDGYDSIDFWDNNAIYKITYFKFSHVVADIEKVDRMRKKDGNIDYVRLEEWNNHSAKKP